MLVSGLLVLLGLLVRLGLLLLQLHRGANATASDAAMRAWFSGLVVAVNANSSVMFTGGIPSSMFFHHLTLAEYGAIVLTLQANPTNLVWGSALMAVGLIAGTFYMVTAGGRGRNVAMQQRYVPFLWCRRALAVV
ncbi:hypothetical protein PF005_g23505 [Phytophthora fragariae]|uniref:Uncharacterized protein n=1 Tax=Phytophthora fragariae TaxID=53985 RepID=A0A6A3E0D0_9STRA|nr:hypothetical protein PF003_g25928 [Phytophthora fragariae]KAE8925647.1 hypothetical protein PF009_g24146 [Phytophthora fragariae]KAE8981079.1 hypothetical protein PF011_g22174 [Phytophthora fragariae]KAE9079285.1 hypothetical protein PF007_g23511 [Phytophthora fragariae]KAE9102057.1 hypothetical protein PF006_g22525 [Phytophthora fragariae]